MRLPRNISGSHLARLLSIYGYTITRRSGSHIRLTTNQSGEHHITIPDHKELRVGTLHAIINDIADHFSMNRDELAKTLFEK